MRQQKLKDNNDSKKIAFSICVNSTLLRNIKFLVEYSIGYQLFHAVREETLTVSTHISILRKNLQKL